MKSLFTLVLVFTISLPAYSGSLSTGPTKDGGVYYQQDGCQSFNNIIGNVNGYTTTPAMAGDLFRICGKLDLAGRDFKDLLLQVAG